MSKIIIDNDSTSLGYPVISDSCANLETALDIWIKFTGYIRPEELLFLQEVKDKNFDYISQNELDKYSRIKKQLTISKLLLKYKNKECTKEEHDQVLEFMHTSLKLFIQSRLTDDEIELASEYIYKLETNDQLKKHIETKQKIYESLNIYESYILFEAKERLYYLEQKQLREKIRNDLKDKNTILKKNLIRDYGHKF